MEKCKCNFCGEVFQHYVTPGGAILCPNCESDDISSYEEEEDLSCWECLVCGRTFPEPNYNPMEEENECPYCSSNCIQEIGEDSTWECPECGGIYGPDIESCPYCNGEEDKTND